MDDWNQNNSSWSGYGDDPWDMPPKTSARPKRHASRDESAGHSAAPGHTIGSCDADYANEAVNPGRKRIRWRRIVLPLVVALIAAGAALVIAALAAKGESEISCVQYIERGYENIVEKLRGLGADIRAVEVPGDNDELEAHIG